MEDVKDQNRPNPSDLLTLTTEIIAAHVGHNAVAPADVPALIQSVHQALAAVGGAAPVAEPAQQPAVPIRRSVQPDHLVCLEDGRKMKMLKRHLMTAYGMTPDDYRQKWGLPASYPMVAPSYAQRRSALAKEIGLGKGSRRDAPPAAKRAPARRTRKTAAT